MPKVSIIIPVYNVEPYLRTALDSVVRQTLKDIEIICVNDGSKDGCPGILREYAEKDERIVLIDQENGGYGKAMNAGLDRVTGEYTGILEPDDYVALTMYEDLYRKAKEYDLDLVKADFLRFYTNEKEETETRLYSHLCENREEYDYDPYNTVFRPRDRKDSFFYTINTWTGIYRTSFLREHGIRHNETPGAAFQDNGFWFQTFLYAQRAMILDKPYYRVRRDNPNSSVNNPEKVYAVNREYDYIRGILERDPEVWEEMKGVYWRKRFSNIKTTFKRIAPEFRAEYETHVRRELEDGLKAGEFSEKDLPEDDREKLQAMLRGEYAKSLPPQPKAVDEAEMIRQSAAYRIGSAVTRVPRMMRRILRGG